MKPFDDPDCECHKIQNQINANHPDADWGCDEVCEEWNKRSSELKDNDIELDEFSDDPYSCTCPTCGRFICGDCV